MTDRIGTHIQVGDTVLSVQSKYRGFKYILGIVDGFTEKRVRIRYTDLLIDDKSKEETSMKSPESLIVVETLVQIHSLESVQLLRGKL